MSAPPLDRLGQALADRYTVIREIGHGGMATVFLAEDLRLHRQVALKVVRPEISQSLGPARFLHEIDVAARLQHPHISSLLDAGHVEVDAGSPVLYYTMPFVAGESLRSRLDRETYLGLDEALRIAGEVADALSYAHSRDIVHRDIKPENILLSEGHAVVTDFGIAKAVTSTGQQFTQTEVTLGTPHYMSPEQADCSRPVDGRCDQYSLGCVLYEMLGGQPPFTAPTAQAVLARHALDPVPSLRTLRETVPAGVEEAIARALAKVPADRFDSVGEFVAALTVAHSEGGRRPAAPLRARRGLRGWPRRTLVALVAVVPVAVLIGVWSRPNAGAGRLHEDRVAVAPFNISGPDSSLAYLREGMALVLASRFTGEGGPRAIDPPEAFAAWHRAAPPEGDPRSDAEARVARALGAGSLLVGGVVRLDGNSLMLSAKLVSLMLGRRVEATAQGPSDSLPALADRLAAMLLARIAGEPERRVPALTTASLPAVRAFLAGRAAYRSGRYEAAVADFSRALARDSTFALAALELASAASLRIKARPIDAALADQGWWSEADSSWQRAVELAFRERQRLDSRDLGYLQAMAGVRYPRVPSAAEQLALWEQTVQAQPDRADAWQRFGLALLYHGPSAEVADARDRAATAFRRALAVDSTFAGALEGLFEVAAFARDTGQIQRLGEWYLARYPLSDDANYVRWRVATSTGDLRSLQRLRRRFDSLSAASLVRIQWTSQVDGVALEDAERAVDVLLRRAGDRVERSRAVGLATVLNLNRGRPRQALGLATTVADLNQVPYWNRLFRVVYALYWSGDSAGGASAAHEVEGRARALLARAGWRAEAISARELFVPEQWRLWQGDTTLADRAVAILLAAALTDTGLVWETPSSRTARAAPQGSPWAHRVVLLEAILAQVAQRPDASGLLARLDSLSRLACCAAPHYTNLVLARLYERAGDLKRALDAIRRARWYFPPEYFSTSLREEGRLAALTGDREGAIRAYRHFLILWEQAEPEQARQLEAVRAELRRVEAAQR